MSGFRPRFVSCWSLARLGLRGSRLYACLFRQCFDSQAAVAPTDFEDSIQLFLADKFPATRAGADGPSPSELSESTRLRQIGVIGLGPTALSFPWT